MNSRNVFPIYNSMGPISGKLGIANEIRASSDGPTIRIFFYHKIAVISKSCLIKNEDNSFSKELLETYPNMKDLNVFKNEDVIIVIFENFNALKFLMSKLGTFDDEDYDSVKIFLEQC